MDDRRCACKSDVDDDGELLAAALATELLARRIFCSLSARFKLCTRRTVRRNDMAPSDMAPPPDDILKRMCVGLRVPELQAELRRRGKSGDGKRAELVDRLVVCLRSDFASVDSAAAALCSRPLTSGTLVGSIVRTGEVRAHDDAVDHVQRPAFGLVV